MLCSKNNKRKQLIPLIPQFFPKLTVCAWTQHLSFWFLLSSQFLRCMLVWMFVWMAVSPRVVVWWMVNSWFNPQAPWLWRRTLRSWGWSRRTAQEPVFTRPPQVSQVFSHNTSRIPLNLVNICVCVCGSCTERVCASGASARGRENHRGGDEEQRANCHRGEVSIKVEFLLGVTQDQCCAHLNCSLCLFASGAWSTQCTL